MALQPQHFNTMPSERLLPISVCMIAGNEAQRIRKALDSVSGWAGEIIVVLNDDVNDGTDQIATVCGAKVFREPWRGHVAQKNSAAGKATQPWILGLDADEEVSPALRDEIRRAIVEPGGSAAFCFPRCTNFCGRWIRHGDWYPDRKTRLWRRGAAEWGGIDPHDKLFVRGDVGKLRHDLLHHAAETIDRQMAKISTYAETFARECEARGRRVNFADVMWRPWWRFLRAYFFKFGFLDGWQGYVIARMTAFYTFLRYLKAREAQSQLSERH
jgi:glycosyltransferase involved in cell wall biosynthesis